MPKARFSRRPCFQNIWRDTASDLAWFQFSDGTLYEYTPAGSAASACDCAFFDPHGNYFDLNVRIPHGTAGFTKVGSVPGTATQVYTYPPYDNAAAACNPCNGLNENYGSLAWTINATFGGTAFVTSSGNVVHIGAAAGQATLISAVTTNTICTPRAVTALNFHVFNNSTSSVNVGVGATLAAANANKIHVAPGFTGTGFFDMPAGSTLLYIAYDTAPQSGGYAQVTLPSP